MTRRRTFDPDDLVVQERQRAHGVQTQADVEARQRFQERVGEYGEAPQEIPGPLTINNDLNWEGSSVINWPIGGTDQSIIIISQGDGVFSEHFKWLYEAGFASFQAIDTLPWPFFELDNANSKVKVKGAAFLEVYDLDENLTAWIESMTGAASFASLTSTGTPIAQPDQWLAGFHANHGLSTLTAMGMAAPTTSGTLGNASTADGPVLEFTTTAVSGNDAQIITAANWESRWGIDATFRIRTGAITDTQLWAVLSAADPSGSATPLLEHVGFRFSTAAPDTNWRVHSSDGVNTNSTDSGIEVLANTSYTLRVVSANGSSFDFYIDGVLVETYATDLPATTTDLAVYLSVSTLAAATKNFRVHHVKVLSR